MKKISEMVGKRASLSQLLTLHIGAPVTAIAVVLDRVQRRTNNTGEKQSMWSERGEFRSKSCRR